MFEFRCFVFLELLGTSQHFFSNLGLQFRGGDDFANHIRGVLQLRGPLLVFPESGVEDNDEYTLAHLSEAAQVFVKEFDSVVTRLPDVVRPRTFRFKLTPAGLWRAGNPA